MAKNLMDVTVRCDDAAPAVVRTAISNLDAFASRVLEDAKLVASELVTNAVRHSLCTAEELLRVRITGDGWLRIAVFDPGRSGGVAELANRPVAFGGMGLKVVEQVACRWGTERWARGYEVWADLEIQA